MTTPKTCHDVWIKIGVRMEWTHKIGDDVKFGVLYFCLVFLITSRAYIGEHDPQCVILGGFVPESPMYLQMDTTGV